MRAINLRFPRAPAGLPARIGSALARPSAKMREWGGAVANLPALRRAEGLLAVSRTPDLPKRRLRVPDEALLSLSTGPSPLLLAAPPAAPSANDNASAVEPPASTSRPISRRDLVFLGMLLLSLAGAYWQGRMQGYQKIISVPGPSLPGSKVT